MFEIYICKLTITNVATARYFEVMSHKFNVDKVCAYENKWWWWWWWWWW